MLTYKLFLDGPVQSAAFPDPTTGDFDVELVSLTSRKIVWRQPDTGFTTTLTGRGFKGDASVDTLVGTVTGITIRNASGDVVGTLSGMTWNASRLLDGLKQSYDDDYRAYAALWSQQSVLIDMSERTDAGFYALGTGVATYLTSDVTWVGSARGDTFNTSQGRDIVRLGASQYYDTGEVIYGSSGSDTFDFSGLLPRSSTGAIRNSYIDITYKDVSGPITVTLNAATNKGTVAGTGWTDRLIDVRRALADADGLGLYGTADNDRFIVTPGSSGFVTVAGYAGADSYTLTLNGSVRLSFHTGFLKPEEFPTRGVVMDLRSGQVRDDGFGNRETITLLGGTGWLEIEGTNRADRITGSDRDEGFIPRGGNDTIDGGAGTDRVRYIRSGEDSAVRIDLGRGTATGSFKGVEYSHKLIGIEDIRFGLSNPFNDVVRGSNAANRLDGAGAAGNSSISGRGGNDTIWGGSGHDTIKGDSGNDLIFANAGSDKISGGSGFDTIIGGLGNDSLTGGTQSDVFAFESDFGRDRVTDFQNGIDKFDFISHFASSFSELTVSTVGSDARIADNAGNVIVVVGAAGQIDASDFLF